MPAGSGSDPLSIVAARRSPRDLVRCGAELVGLSERFYGGVFVGAVVFVGLAALAALVLWPLRHSAATADGAVTPAVVATALLVAITPWAIWRAGALYRILRRRRSAEVALVLVSGLLVAYPMRSELWWPSCAIVMLLAIVVPFSRVLAYCLVVLAASFASHAIGGDLREMSAVSIIGLCIGYPLWSATVAVSTELLAAHVLRLNTTRGARRPPPLRVRAWTTAPAHEPRPPPETRPTAAVAELSTDDDDTTTSTALQRLTARQLQVVALLADGLRYRDVADCLSISVRQVQRHVRRATARLGLRNAYELVAVAVAEGMVPIPDRDGNAALAKEHDDARGPSADQGLRPSGR